ncbi:hypothetical protein AMTRI_Chr10g228280 [Amborella trichopoda]
MVDQLQKRGIPIPNRCVRCLCEEETNPHLFLHCNLAYGLWGQMLQLSGVQWIMRTTVKELLSLYPVLHWPMARRTIWKAAVAAIIWTIWNERNSRIFQGIATEGPALFHKVTSLVTFWASNHRIFVGLPANSFLYNGEILCSTALARPKEPIRGNPPPVAPLNSISTSAPSET